MNCIDHAIKNLPFFLLGWWEKRNHLLGGVLRYLVRFIKHHAYKSCTEILDLLLFFLKTQILPSLSELFTTVTFRRAQIKILGSFYSLFPIVWVRDSVPQILLSFLHMRHNLLHIWFVLFRFEVFADVVLLNDFPTWTVMVGEDSFFGCFEVLPFFVQPNGSLCVEISIAVSAFAGRSFTGELALYLHFFYYL